MRDWECLVFSILYTAPLYWHSGRRRYVDHLVTHVMLCIRLPIYEQEADTRWCPRICSLVLSKWSTTQTLVVLDCRTMVECCAEHQSRSTASNGQRATGLELTRKSEPPDQFHSRLAYRRSSTCVVLSSKAVGYSYQLCNTTTRCDES